MVIDPFGATLASIALLSPIYDSCCRMYDGLKVMKTFGRDVQILFIQLQTQWVIFYQIMQRQKSDLSEPLDPDNPYHRITAAVCDLLSVLETHLKKCESLVMKQLDKSKLASLPLAGHHLPSSTSPVPSYSASETNIQKEAQTHGKHTTSGTNKSLLKIFRSLVHSKREKDRANDHGAIDEPASTRSEETTLGSHSPSLRESLPIKQLSELDIVAISNKSPAARLIQAKTRLWVHVTWAHHDRQEFGERIDEIRKTVRDLGLILALRDPERPGTLLAVKRSVEPGKFSPLSVQEALERMHNTLKTINTTSSKSSPWTIGICAISRPVEDWKLLYDQTQLPLRTGSFVFYLQRFRSLKIGEESTLLMVEITQKGDSREKVLESSLPRLSDLDRPQQTEAGLEADSSMRQDFEAWGSMCAARTPHDQHNVFAETTPWRAFKSLGELLDDNEFRTHLALLDLVKLSIIILTAHIDLSIVRQQCGNLRIDSFVYFTEPECQDEADEPSAEDPLFLRPYISCGFGQSLPQQRIGAPSRFAAKDPSSAVVEIGLVLFQLGSLEKMVYGSSTTASGLTSLQDAKKRALRDLASVETRYGLSFASVVEVCLSSSAGTEIDDVATCLDKLEEIRSSLVR